MRDLQAIIPDNTTPAPRLVIKAAAQALARSPYLNKPLRTVAQALRDQNAKRERIEELRAIAAERAHANRPWHPANGKD